MLMATHNFTSNGFATDPAINGLNAFGSIEGLVCLRALYFAQDGVSESSDEPQSIGAVTAFMRGFSSSQSGGGLAYLDRLTCAGNRLLQLAGGLGITERARRVSVIARDAWKSEYLYRAKENSRGKMGRAAFANDGFGKPKLMRGRYPELIRIRREIDSDKREAEDRILHRMPMDRQEVALRALTAKFRAREDAEYLPLYKAEVREVIENLTALVKPLARLIEPRLDQKRAEFEPTSDFVNVADMLRVIDMRCGEPRGLVQIDDLVSGYVRAMPESAPVARVASVHSEAITNAVFPDYATREEAANSASRRVNNADRAVESPGIDRRLKGLLPNYMLGKGKRDTAKRQPRDKVDTRALKAFFDDRRAAVGAVRA